MALAIGESEEATQFRASTQKAKCVTETWLQTSGWIDYGSS